MRGRFGLCLKQKRLERLIKHTLIAKSISLSIDFCVSPHSINPLPRPPQILSKPSPRSPTKPHPQHPSSHTHFFPPAPLNSNYPRYFSLVLSHPSKNQNRRGWDFTYYGIVYELRPPAPPMFLY